MKSKSYDYKIIFVEGTLEQVRDYLKSNFNYTQDIKDFQMQDKPYLKLKDKLGNKWQFKNQYLHEDQINMSFCRSVDDLLSRRLTHDEFFDLFTEW